MLPAWRCQKRRAVSTLECSDSTKHLWDGDVATVNCCSWNGCAHLIMGWWPLAALAGTYTFCAVAAACVAARMASLGSWSSLKHIWWTTRKSTVVVMGWNMNMHLDHLVIWFHSFTCPWSVASGKQSLPMAEDDTTILGCRCTKTHPPSSSQGKWYPSPNRSGPLLPYCYGPIP